MTRYRVGVDVGGTFTDVVLMDDRSRLSVKKVLSSPHDYSEAILEALDDLLREHRSEGDRIDAVIHGTTVATNALLTQTGARTGLITTRGFRDILEFARLRLARLYDMDWERAAPLVPRYLRTEVDERIAPTGEIVTPLDMASVARAVRTLLAEKVDSIAVCLLHAYRNPEHEEQIGRYLATEAPGVFVSLSSAVLPEIREFERTSTTVVNAYIQPVVKRYVERLARRMETAGIASPLLLMQSNGGVVTATRATARPVHIIESGPAAGVMGSLFVARRIGMDNLISFDMGGTTAKACIVEGGRVTLATEYEVGAGLNVGHRLLKGGGYLVRVPILDIAEVGAGGGSIAWIAPGGILKVGPQSAGASPGPVSYGQGGTEPTVTDANVVLGYLNPAYLAGGALKLNADAARHAVTESIARPLGLDPVEAAYGIHRIANAMMVRALRAVSIERGRDPRKFPLFAFGGSGPVHAAHLAQETEMSRVVVPQAPGLFSSFGLLFSDLEHHYVQTFWHRFTEEAVDEANRALTVMVTDARRDLAREGYGDGRVGIQAMADLRYVGQNSELSIPLRGETLEPAGLTPLREAFESEHETTYGYRSPKEPVQFVNLRVVARGLQEGASRLAGLPAAAGRSASLAAGPSRRPAYFGPALGWVETAVIGRGELGRGPEPGPLIIEEYDSTTVVPPGCRASRDEWGNVLVEVGKRS